MVLCRAIPGQAFHFGDDLEINLACLVVLAYNLAYIPAPAPKLAVLAQFKPGPIIVFHHANLQVGRCHGKRARAYTYFEVCCVQLSVHKKSDDGG